MADKKIVSIEDHLPKLKEERKKRANRRLILYLSILFFLISIIVYLQSPLSHVRNIQVTGNTLVSESEIKKQSGLSEDTNIWTINQVEIEQNLKNNYLIIESVAVNRKLPWTVEIEVEEYDRVGYVKDEFYYPVLGTGEILEQLKQNRYYGDAPLLAGFTEDEYLHRMASELENLPKSIFNLISEIHWNPTDKNEHKIIVYMNDGYIIDSTIRNFSENITVYPSIVSQLDPDEKGIIHLGAGAYFETLGTSDSGGDNEDDEEKDS